MIPWFFWSVCLHTIFWPQGRTEAVGLLISINKVKWVCNCLATDVSFAFIVIYMPHACGYFSGYRWVKYKHTRRSDSWSLTTHPNSSLLPPTHQPFYKLCYLVFASKRVIITLSIDNYLQWHSQSNCDKDSIMSLCLKVTLCQLWQMQFMSSTSTGFKRSECCKL